MGIKLAVGIAQSLKAADLASFPARVASSVQMRRAAEDLWPVLSSRWPNLEPVNEFASFVSTESLSSTDIEEAWKHGDLPRFVWAGFGLYFGRAAVRAVHIERLLGFVLDVHELREPLRLCVHALARELHSSQVVYGPDCASPFQAVLDAEQGRSLDEIVLDAKRRCGPAAASVRQLANEHEELNLEEGCYCLDAIDLRLR